jgi:hypothetical protein
MINGTVGLYHKVLTYILKRAVCGVFRNIDPPPHHRPASVYHPAFALSSYSIIPLRSTHLNEELLIKKTEQYEQQIKLLRLLLTVQSIIAKTC